MTYPYESESRRAAAEKFERTGAERIATARYYSIHGLLVGVFVASIISAGCVVFLVLLAVSGAQP